jgi:pyridoxamine 5'-phosphate oxidase
MESLARHTDYGQNNLHESHLSSDPLGNFKEWLEAAEGAGIYEPNAFVLGTVNEKGVPNARTVLLKGIIDGKFFFASNYLSQKGLELEANPWASMVFGWYGMHRQVIVQGSVERATRAESVAYFESRPHDSKVASWLSEQSRPIESREALEEAYKAALVDFENKPVQTPEHWGGYLIAPLRIEFWQGRTSRMHDRIEIKRATVGDPWVVTRLQP